MFHAVTTSSPAKAGSASLPASGASRTIARKMSNAWTIPAIGVRPPASTLVAVRAMAPVAGRPPNSGEAILAAPWASSSALVRCAPPIIRSATSAESSDSMPASRAMVTAAGNMSRTSGHEIGGSEGHGSPCGSAPKRLVTVATEGKTSARTLASSTTAARARNCGAKRRTRAMPTIVARPSSSEDQSAVARAVHRPSILGRKSAGSASPRSPARSLSWLVAITTAMPIVKPSTTLSGISRISLPAPSRPPMTRIAPAISVASCRPARPCLAMIA